ncbi:MAG: L-threonine 3-dehydrogenase [Candidatus Schekmanbacteria bacterium]|nr:L-threonine 3-dehydrogenase [Candidatus Schekmanbacteria bacterium]
MKRIMVTGALGQIGSELIATLRGRYGRDQVVGTDIRMPIGSDPRATGPFELLDVLDPNHLTRVMQIYDIGTIYHLAAILSAVGESQPNQAWRINVNGLYNVLEAARYYRCQVFFPSSIGVFGPTTPRDYTPQDTVQRPETMYGVTKLTGELLCDYYHRRFDIDTRGLRFPGLISYKTDPGGGTTDYAVEIFYAAVRHSRYTCYLRPDTSLDMMYMPDAIRAMIELMQADPARLRHRNAFNLAAMAFTPEQLAAAIRRRIADFEISYRVDPARQTIADSWPNCMDDSAARAEWGWRPEYDLERMVDDMLEHVAERADEPHDSTSRARRGS